MRLIKRLEQSSVQARTCTTLLLAACHLNLFIRIRLLVQPSILGQNPGMEFFFYASLLATTIYRVLLQLSAQSGRSSRLWASYNSTGPPKAWAK